MAPPSSAEVSVPIYAAAPLPPGWTEHRAPTGQFYYYHAASGESTYVRPSIPVTANPSDKEQVSNGVVPHGSSGSEKNTNLNNKKKEKPKTKEPIPETVWIKVTTTAGNVFYSNSETKISSWTIPEEIKEQVKRYEEEEARKIEEAKQIELEQARLKAEELKRAQEAEQKRLIELEVQKVKAEVEAEALLRGLKRKNEESSSLHTLPDKPIQSLVATTHSNSVGSDSERQTKVPKLDAADEDQDEAWQREIAAEMAQEAAEQPKPTTCPPQTNPPSVTQNHSTLAGLSPEELKATFKAMLLEKSIDPMAPWDNELPKFVTDARYLALPSMKERRDLFDEFCKEKIRQQRAAKQATPKIDPSQAYRSLLVEFVTSTRMLWEDFKGKHKKDSRFRNFGRDDREREKAFKNWLKELGEQKRLKLIKSEEEYKKLLEEKGHPSEEFKDFKERVKNDARFLAISSNSSKESLWKSWFDEQSKKKINNPQVDQSLDSNKSAEREKKEKQEATLKAREEQVQEMKRKIEKQCAQAKSSVGREEAEREFNSFLIDHVRHHNSDWGNVQAQLKCDSRYEIIKFLPQHELKRIFLNYRDSIYSKHIEILESFFEAQVKEPLIAEFTDVKDKLLSIIEDRAEEGKENEAFNKQMSLEEKMKVKSRILKLIGKEENSRNRMNGIKEIEEIFKEWKVRKYNKAREEFENMCAESSFIEYWCRLKKSAEDEKRKNHSNNTNSIDDEEQEDEIVDLKEMAKSIDFREIQMVLKKDRRWIQWDHLPRLLVFTLALFHACSVPFCYFYDKTDNIFN